MTNRMSLFACLVGVATLAPMGAWAQSPPAPQSPGLRSAEPDATASGWGGDPATTAPRSTRDARQAELQAQRAAFNRRQREMAEEFYYQLGASPLRPWRPSNPYMQSHYPPRQTIYVPMIVNRPEFDATNW